MKLCLLCKAEGKRKKAYKGKYCEKHWEQEKAKKRVTFVPLRDIWYTMMGKCYNEKWGIYKYYGAKGYTVCETWHNRSLFISWAIKNGYTFGRRIAIKDGQKVYSPENCFVTDRKPAKNQKISGI